MYFWNTTEGITRAVEQPLGRGYNWCEALAFRLGLRIALSAGPITAAQPPRGASIRWKIRNPNFKICLPKQDAYF